MNPTPDARTVIEQLPAWFAHYNDVHPHRALRYRSPRGFIAQTCEAPSGLWGGNNTDSGDDPTIRFGNSDAHEDNLFPSGQSAGAVAVAFAFGGGYSDHAIVANTAAFSVSAVQIPRGMHYVGDVVVGVLIGIAGERASDTVLAASRVVFEEDNESLKIGM